MHREMDLMDRLDQFDKNIYTLEIPKREGRALNPASCFCFFCFSSSHSRASNLSRSFPPSRPAQSRRSIRRKVPTTFPIILSCSFLIYLYFLPHKRTLSRAFLFFFSPSSTHLVPSLFTLDESSSIPCGGISRAGRSYFVISSHNLLLLIFNSPPFTPEIHLTFTSPLLPFVFSSFPVSPFYISSFLLFDLLFIYPFRVHHVHYRL